MIKRIFLILLGAILVAQLFQPDRSTPPVDPAKDMLAMTNAPLDIRTLVVGACYDCHSHKTDYPVWAYITPVNFWIQDHINEGRAVVNYSRWDVFAGNEEAAESGESIAEGEMPPSGYAFMHGHAKLIDAQRQQLIEWFNVNVGNGGGEGVGSSGEQEGETEDRD